jgi:hypothetical protein
MCRFKENVKEFLLEVVLPALFGAGNALGKLADTLDVYGPVIEKIQLFADITANIGEVKSL